MPCVFNNHSISSESIISLVWRDAHGPESIREGRGSAGAAACRCSGRLACFGDVIAAAIGIA